MAENMALPKNSCRGVSSLIDKVYAVLAPLWGAMFAAGPGGCLTACSVFAILQSGCWHRRSGRAVQLQKSLETKLCGLPFLPEFALRNGRAAFPIADKTLFVISGVGR